VCGTGSRLLDVGRVKRTVRHFVYDAGSVQPK
jgi:hypothetical protein